MNQSPQPNTRAKTANRIAMLTWLFSLASWPIPLLMLSLSAKAALLGVSSSTDGGGMDMLVMILFHFCALLAVPGWLVAICFRKARISFPVHLLQVLVYVAGWKLTIPALKLLDSQGYPTKYLSQQSSGQRLRSSG